MTGTAITQPEPMTCAPRKRASTSSHGVEPNHWFPVWTGKLTNQDVQPRFAASIPSSSLPVAARQVPCFAPEAREYADNPDGYRYQGT